MSDVNEVLREVLDATEFVAIVTQGPDGPHVVGNWGDYIRKLGPTSDTIVIPAGGYQQTEKNLASDPRIQLLVASREVQGSQGPGQGCTIHGTAELVTDGPVVDEVKQHFPWARGALVMVIEEVLPHL